MFGALSAIGSIFSAIGTALSLLRDYGLYLMGKKAQQNADLTETIKEGQDAAKVEADVAMASDADVDKRLQQYARKQ